MLIGITRGCRGGSRQDLYLSQHPLLLRSPSVPLPPLLLLPLFFSSSLHLCPSHAPLISYSSSLFSFFSSPFSSDSTFKHLFPFQLHRLHSFQQLPAPFCSPSLFSPPLLARLSVSTFLLQSIFASLSKPRPLLHPSILSSIHPYSTSRWIENKVLQRLSRWGEKKGRQRETRK